MDSLLIITKRNIKIFFKDKGFLLASLMTPIILLVLYMTFLANVYRDSFNSNLPDGVVISNSLINGTVAGQLIASLLAVSAVTVSFCSNLLCVQDKANESLRDFMVSPYKPWKLAISYYLASLFSTLLICYITLGLSFVYLLILNGWYLSFDDVLLIILDIFILANFGTVLSSIVNSFLKTQGQMSAVGTIVSSGYGFICGAYMPLSQFSPWLRNILMFLPGTYATSLIKNHSLVGVTSSLLDEGFPIEVVKGIRDSIDYNIYFFNHQVPVFVMYLVTIISISVLLIAYVFINVIKAKKALRK